MSEINEYIKTREEYVSLIKKELLGPGSEVDIPDSEHEVISTSPDLRYSIGILFPQNSKMNAENGDTARVEESARDDEVAEENESVEPEDDIKEYSEKEERPYIGEEENLDEEIGLSTQDRPSSTGITFFVCGNTEKINCQVRFGMYRKLKASDCCFPFLPEDSDNFDVPEQLSSYLKYDKNLHCLRLCQGGITRKTIKELENNEILESDDYGLFNIMRRLCDQLRSGYVRIPHNIRVNLDFNNSDYIDNNKNLDGTNAKLTALRRHIKDDIYSITVMLVNDDKTKSNGSKCIFQPEILIDSSENLFVFVEYARLNSIDSMDEEEKSLALQYRNKKIYGTGLGTSVNWDIDSNGNGKIYNDFFPEKEVPQMDFSLPKEFNTSHSALSMKYLSDLNNIPKKNKIEDLKTLVDAYGKWISELEKKAGALDRNYPGMKFSETAFSNIEGCKKSYRRMSEGLEKLKEDDLIWDAFTLANRAMFMQRVHLQLQKETADHDRYPYDDELNDLLDSIDYIKNEGLTKDVYFWRPFQIAFFLMSINGVADENSPDRDLVDLIWFPTGGGKTEAYLGLTAFTIFYRRLKNLDTSGGTAVIMRYTLRLLAAQQFTRASTLICACEYIRSDSMSRKPKYKMYPLGNQSITIGLWIGSEHTPNKNADANEHLEKLLKSTYENLKENKDKHNKFQVLKCPWCGTKLVKDRVDKKVKGVFAYRMKNNRHFEMYCPQESCFFNSVGKLPIQIVDEELYANPPTLLFGTVDKFAMLPWKAEIGNFFGINSNNRTPELIIQDELHLISGPLGTMVGLYETAVDVLCRSKGTKAKIVASTATIRRAKEQCSALYNRDVAQFPHPGLDAEDSFFARELNVNYEKNNYGRLYVGLMPSGKTKAMMEVRTIAALLQTINTMTCSDEIKDKFWTLTVYFNSLKDLGKCSNLVDDDVKDFIKRIAYRLGCAHDARIIVGADELTSRVSTTELNETLDKLEKLEYSEKNREEKRYASNIVLATNMISVGIDVARLNVMLLVGQPKLTSEYIQASSRIGRSVPGVAFVLYDGSKSRDRSHYEQFKPYHESFYRYVEPTGVTPFSKPARDRALHAVVISLLRHLIPELSPEKGAALFSTEKYSETIEKIKDFIKDRNSSIIEKLHSGMVDDREKISDEIDEILNDWQNMAESYDEDHFDYGEKYMVKNPDQDFGRLMKVFNSDQNDQSAFDTMTSMRNVDATVAGNVLVWED